MHSDRHKPTSKAEGGADPGGNAKMKEHAQLVSRFLDDHFYRDRNIDSGLPNGSHGHIKFDVDRTSPKEALLAFTRMGTTIDVPGAVELEARIRKLPERITAAAA